jgi:hypothetical protein
MVSSSTLSEQDIATKVLAVLKQFNKADKAKVPVLILTHLV